MYLLGIALLVTTYADRLGYQGYWLGVGLAFTGVLAAGFGCRPRISTHAVALAGMGLLLWLPYYLRAPRRLIFTDEFFHLQVLQHLQSVGNLNIKETFYPIPGDYPGLEFTALTLHGATGVSTLAATRIVTLTLHILIPLLVYLAALGLGRRPKVAFLVAIVYTTNTSYGFFHDIFSYESLGIVFFLAIWASSSRRPDPAGRTRTSACSCC